MHVLELQMIASSFVGELNSLTASSIALFSVCFILQWLAAQFGARVLGKRAAKHGEAEEHLRITLGATLSLLGLIIGFTLSMAIGGFNGRQIAEEGEAETIRTAYMRADLLPHDEKVKVRGVLENYLQQRLRFYNNEDAATRIEARRAAQDLQNEAWRIVSPVVAQKRDSASILVLTGINDMINSQQKAYAGWRTQVPAAAWLLLIIFSVSCNVLVGYNARRLRQRTGLLIILPITISLAFMVISEIDGPGRGIIREQPVNLEYLTIVKSEYRSPSADEAEAP